MAASHPLSTRRVSDQLAGILRERIFQRALVPGQRLIELDLCEELEVSRAPLREALLRLEREGLVEIRPHRGAIVVEVSEADLPDINELRVALETIALEKAAAKQSPELIEHLSGALDTIRNAGDAGDTTAAALAHLDFHRALGRASGNARLAAFIDQLTAQSLALRAYAADLPSELLHELAALHQPILEVIARGEPARAREVMEEHILAPTDFLSRYYRDSFSPSRPEARSRA